MVTNPFCDNPLCRLHVTHPDTQDYVRYIEANGKEVTARRIKIIVGKEATGNIFNFCEICANVCAMVHGKR